MSHSGGGRWFNIHPVIFESKILSIIADWLNSFHIYGFTLVSGYIFQYLKNERNKYKEFLPFLATKIKRLLVPYVFASIMWVIPISCILFSYTSRDIILKFILCTSPSQLWFLWMLFGVFFMVWNLNKWINEDLIALILSCLSWIIGFICGSIFPNVFCIWTVFNYLPFFILGMKIRQKKSTSVYNLSNLVLVIFQIVLFIMWQITLQKKILVFKLASLIFQYSANVVGAIMSFFILHGLADKVNYRKNKLFSTFSKQSMSIYLIHQQVIYFTIMIFNGKVNSYLNASINFIVALFVSSLISKSLMKYKATRFLIGEKT